MCRGVHLNIPFRKTFRTASISFRNSMFFAWFLARGALSGGFHCVLRCFLHVLCFPSLVSSLFPICFYGVSFGFLCSYVSLLMRFLSGVPRSPLGDLRACSLPNPFRFPSGFLPKNRAHFIKKIRRPKVQFFLGCAQHSNDPVTL